MPVRLKGDRKSTVNINIHVSNRIEIRANLTTGAEARIQSTIGVQTHHSKIISGKSRRDYLAVRLERQ